MDAKRLSAYLRPGCPDATVLVPVALTTTGGGCRLTCRRRQLEDAVDLSAASPWMRGGGCSTCCRDDNWRRQTAPYLRHRCLEEAVALLAASPWMRGGGRPTCSVAAKKPQSTYLPPRRQLEEVVDLTAASPWMRGGGCLTCCCLDDN